jgi:hypothetical protein
VCLCLLAMVRPLQDVAPILTSGVDSFEGGRSVRDVSRDRSRPGHAPVMTGRTQPNNPERERIPTMTLQYFDRFFKCTMMVNRNAVFEELSKWLEGGCQ